MEPVFARAYTAHRNGRLDEAERGYRATLATHPDHADALHLLGVLHHQQGQHTEAVALVRRAVMLRPDDAGMQLNLGNALKATGRLEQAIERFRNALTLAPDFPLAYYNLGNACAALGRHEEAKDAFGHAVRLQPGDAASHNNLGNELHALGHYDEAADAFYRALRLRPGYAGAHNNLGMALNALGDTHGAVMQFHAALQAEPRFVAAHFNLGNTFDATGDHARAIAAFEAVLALQPRFTPALLGLGNALTALGRHDAAVQVLERALGLDPNFALAWLALGIAHHALGRHESALRAFDEALRTRPDLAAAHLNRAFVWLTLGDFRRGLPEYEWRLNPAANETAGDGMRSPPARKPAEASGQKRDAFHVQPVIAISAPRWQGEPLAGRTLLVRAEQGFGDTLQFVRFIPLVLEHAGASTHASVSTSTDTRATAPRKRHRQNPAPRVRIVLEVQPLLLPLIAQAATSWHGVMAVAQHSPDLAKLAVNYQCPLLSLPLVLGTTLDTLPRPVPYLAAPRAYQRKWRGSLDGKARRKIGIAWAGRIQKNETRALPLAALDPLFALPGIDWIVLQPELTESDASALAHHLNTSSIHQPGKPGRPFVDFADTAAVIERLDAVVSIDTSIAHLAGALGKPLWLMLSFAADWRWFTGNESPWYAHARLVRQPCPGTDADAWKEVVAEIAQALREE